MSSPPPEKLDERTTALRLIITNDDAEDVFGWFYPTRLIHLARFVLKGDGAHNTAIWHGMVQDV